MYLPEQQPRFEFYRGVELCVDVYRQPSGQWIWTYIAGELWSLHQGPHLRTAGAALTQGMLAARARRVGGSSASSADETDSRDPS